MLVGIQALLVLLITMEDWETQFEKNKIKRALMHFQCDLHFDSKLYFMQHACLFPHPFSLVLTNIFKDQRLPLGFSHLVFLLQALFASQDYSSTTFALVPNL